MMLRVIAPSLLVLTMVSASLAAETPAKPAPSNEVPSLAAMKAMKFAPGETIVFVEDLHCATCAKKVTSQLFKLKGVVRVRTSIEHDAAVVTSQARKPLDVAAAWSALQAAGYQPTRLVGPSGEYIANGEKKAPLKVAEAPAAGRK